MSAIGLHIQMNRHSLATSGKACGSRTMSSGMVSPHADLAARNRSFRAQKQQGAAAAAAAPGARKRANGKKSAVGTPRAAGTAAVAVDPTLVARAVQWSQMNDDTLPKVRNAEAVVIAAGRMRSGTPLARKSKGARTGAFMKERPLTEEEKFERKLAASQGNPDGGRGGAGDDEFAREKLGKLKQKITFRIDGHDGQSFTLNLPEPTEPLSPSALAAASQQSTAALSPAPPSTDSWISLGHRPGAKKIRPKLRRTLSVQEMSDQENDPYGTGGTFLWDDWRPANQMDGKRPAEWAAPLASEAPELSRPNSGAALAPGSSRADRAPSMSLLLQRDGTDGSAAAAAPVGGFSAGGVALVGGELAEQHESPGGGRVRRRYQSDTALMMYTSDLGVGAADKIDVASNFFKRQVAIATTYEKPGEVNTAPDSTVRRYAGGKLEQTSSAPRLRRCTLDAITDGGISGEGETMELLNAVEQGDKDLVEELLSEGHGSVDEANGAGLVPLMVAAGFDWPDMLAMLLTHAPEIDAQDEDGYTALHYCALGGHVDSAVSKMLLDAGADVAITNLAGESYAKLSDFAARVAADMKAQKASHVEEGDAYRLRLIRARQRLALAKILPKKFWGCSVEGSIMDQKKPKPLGDADNAGLDVEAAATVGGRPKRLRGRLSSFSGGQKMASPQRYADRSVPTFGMLAVACGEHLESFDQHEDAVEEMEDLIFRTEMDGIEDHAGDESSEEEEEAEEEETSSYVKSTYVNFVKKYRRMSTELEQTW